LGTEVSGFIETPGPILVWGTINEKKIFGSLQTFFELCPPIIALWDVLRNEDRDLALSGFLDDRFQCFDKIGVFRPMTDKDGSRYHDLLPSSDDQYEVFPSAVSLLQTSFAPDAH
jgi:hypothetical protein